MSRLLLLSFEAAAAPPAEPAHFTRAIDDEARAQFLEDGMTQTIKRRQGDDLPPIRAIAYRVNGGPVDLTKFTSVTFKMVCGATIKSGPATGDAYGTLTYELAAGDTDTPGTYDACFKAVNDSGKEETFPAGRNLTVVIVPAL